MADAIKRNILHDTFNVSSDARIGMSTTNYVALMAVKAGYVLGLYVNPNNQWCVRELAGQSTPNSCEVYYIRK